MTQTTKVFIAFNLEFLGGEFFTLDDSVKGVLDNTTFPLVGDTFVDVTEFVKSVSITRGASRELTGFQTGQATVTLNNHSRIFDPFNSAGTYFGQIVPRKKFKVTRDGVSLFTGTIDDWDLSYNVSGDSVATIVCSDGFNYFANTLLDSFTNTLELAGDRVNTILSRAEVNWPLAARDVDTGTSTMRADVVDGGTEVLGYLQKVALSERANIFMNKNNLVVFDDISLIIDRATTPIFADNNVATNIPFTNISVIYGTENLYNRVSATNDGGITQTVDDLTSQQEYGVSAFALDGLLLTDDAGANNLATNILGQFKDPELRIDSVTISFDSLDASAQSTILGFELLDVARVIFTPNNVGSSIDTFVEIIGLNHELSPDSHNVTIFFRSVGTNPFILDDTTNGVLAIFSPLNYDDSAFQYNSSLALYDSTVVTGFELG